MTAAVGSRAGRAQANGDIIRYRVGTLVAEHAQTTDAMVSAMWAAIDAHVEAQRAHVAGLERLVGAIDYELSRGGVSDYIRAVACRRLIDAHKASGLSTRGGEGAWCSSGGGRPVGVDGTHGSASTAGGRSA